MYSSLHLYKVLLLQDTLPSPSAMTTLSQAPPFNQATKIFISKPFCMLNITLTDLYPVCAVLIAVRPHPPQLTAHTPRRVQGGVTVAPAHTVGWAGAVWQLTAGPCPAWEARALLGGFVTVTVAGTVLLYSWTPLPLTHLHNGCTCVSFYTCANITFTTLQGALPLPNTTAICPSWYVTMFS